MSASLMKKMTAFPLKTRWLFAKDKRTISEHIRNIFDEGELQEASVVRKFQTTAADGKHYQVAHYNLDVIISQAF